ncbi:MAG: two-component system response regulator [Bacteroidetes bacterium]|nr:MAG: two-component system response regulator [Bacteroidota bacterium]
MPVKILTVDDSMTIRSIVKNTLKEYDCEIHEAENGLLGLQAIIRIIPDLVILDITMPVMDGIEMLRKLRSSPRGKDMKVIMLTAESAKENIIEIAKLGVTNYIVKPFTKDQLMDKISGLVEIRKL